MSHCSLLEAITVRFFGDVSASEVLAWLDLRGDCSPAAPADRF
jgi:hypothetical protein